jgi:hypothetical protein
MDPAARSVAASRQMIPAARTIGQSARERRTLIRSMAAKDKVNGRDLRGP